MDATVTFYLLLKCFSGITTVRIKELEETLLDQVQSLQFVMGKLGKRR